MNIKPTSEKAAEYWGFGKQCLELKAYGAKAVVDGIYTIICKYTPDEAVLIAIKGGNFISTPRLLAKNNGYDEALKPQGNGGLAYPLDDLTKTSQVLDEDMKVDRSVQLYGNIDWTGTGTPPDSDAPVLTWKGPPSRYFPLSDSDNISGLSVVDEEIAGPPPQTIYTCFGPHVYQEGEILATAPALANGLMPKVLGAALFRGGDLVVIVGNNYRGVTAGFAYDAYLAGTPWKKIGSINSSRQKTPFFFNQSGTEAATIQDNILFTARFTKADNGDMTCVFTKDENICEGVYSHAKASSSSSSGRADSPGTAYASSGDYTGDLIVSATGTGTLTATRTETCKVAVDYIGDNMEFSWITRTDHELSVNTETGSSTYELAPVYSDTPPSALSAGFANLSEDGQVVVNTTTVTGNGGCGPYVFSGSGTVDPVTGLITAVGSCGSPGSSAMISFTVTDANGTSASASAKSPSGYYSATVNNTALSCTESGPSCECSCASSCGCQHSGSGYFSGCTWIATGTYSVAATGVGLFPTGCAPLASGECGSAAGCRVVSITTYNWVCP